MCQTIRRCRKAGWTIGVLLTMVVFVLPQDLSLRVLGGVHRVRSERREGRFLYRLVDFTAPLGLKTSGEGRRFSIEGPRGRVMLRDGRSLVKASDGPDVLLSDAVTKDRRHGWLVPKDFLTRIVPRLVDERVERLGAESFQMVSRRAVQVAVRLENYPPDRVRIVFEPRGALATPTIGESDEALEVAFEGRVIPMMPTKTPDPRLLSNLEFDAQKTQSVFRLTKGPQFGRFNDFQLNAPTVRRVLDIFAGRPEQREDSTAITIDPGHGGRDRGVSAPGIEESAFALGLARRIQRHLESSGYSCKLTRNRDVPFSLDQRSAVANSYKTRAFVSLHLANSIRTTLSGPVVYVHSRSPIASITVPESVRDPEARRVPGRGLSRWEKGQSDHIEESRRLAQILQEELNQLYGTSNSVIELPLSVLAPVTAPAVMIELGYVSNADDLEKLGSPVFQEQMATAVGQVLEDYVNGRN